MKKKVLFFVPFLKARAGGSPKVASSLTLELSKKYDISILTVFHFKESYPYKGTYYTINVRKFFFGVLLNIYRLKAIIKRLSPDIIISFMNLTSFWIIPMMYLFKINVPLIISINSNPESQYKKRVYFKYLIKILYPLKKLTAVVPVSKELKTILTTKYRIPSSKIIPIYIGIESRKILEMSMEEITEYEEVFNNSNIIKFVTLGRLSGEKGHKYLIDAFSSVLKEIPNSNLFIIGDGRSRPKIEQQIRAKKLQDKIILMGFVTNPYNYISKSTIFVLPSLHEGLPYALIEALICKIPIVSTNCRTGPKEILEDGKYGILTKVADSEDLAQNMIKLAKDVNLREHFIKISHQRIKMFEHENFIKSWEKLIDYYLKS